MLIGKTTNTNLTWLAGQLTHAGGLVRRALTVRDEINEIADALTLVFERHPNLLVVSGGLGPTFDDKTLQGIAFKLGIYLSVNDIAVGLIKTRVKELNAARLKMAHLPFGSRPLRNPRGTAPGVYLKAGRTHIFALPGVPSEMRAIFKNSVSSFLRRTFELGELYEASLLLFGIPESRLAPHIDESMARSPNVYVKSHPLGIEAGRPKISLHLTSNTSQEDVEKAKRTMAAKIRRLGGIVTS